MPAIAATIARTPTNTGQVRPVEARRGGGGMLRIRRAAASLRARLIHVRLLLHATLVHLPALREVLRWLVPPDRATLLLVAVELGAFGLELLDEARDLGFVMTSRQHHDALRK